MKFRPHKNFYITSNLNIDEIKKKLNENLNSISGSPFKTIFSNIFSGKEFDGRIIDDYFEIRPAINFRKTVMPEIKGLIAINGDCSRIHIRTQLDTYGFIVLYGLLISIGLISISLTILHIVNDDFEVSLLIPYLLMPAVYYTMMSSFKRESHRSVNILASIFEGELEK